MGLWRTVLGSVVLLAVLWWLYPRAAGETAGDRTEIVIWFNGAIEGRHLDVLDAFERRFPQYRAILGSAAARGGIVEGEGNPQRLMCGIAGGVPPDVVEYDRFAVCQWAARKAFLDLNPLIEADRAELDEARRELTRLESAGADGDQLQARRAQVKLLESFLIQPEGYYAQTWDECTYGDGQYGVPNYMDDRLLYYNADLLVQAEYVDDQGRAVPPDTWEQVLTKLVDASDARIRPLDERSARITSPAADFLAAGLRPGDTLSHISESGVVRRCLVDSVASAHELVVRSAYPRRKLVLPDKENQHIKVFDQDGYAIRLSRWDNEGRMKVVGFDPHHGNGWLYMWGWMNGGEFLSPDGRRCTMADPRIEAALQWTTDVHDALGGVQDVNAFKKAFQREAQDPFFQNQIAAFVNGDWFLRDLARFARHMRFGVHPAPVPAERLQQEDGRYFTWVAGFAYCIPSTCSEEKRQAAWWLLKYLSSVEGGMVMNEHDAQRERGQGRLYMPRLKANKALTQKQREVYMDIPEMPERVRAAMRAFIDMLPFGRFRPVSPEGKKLWDAQATAQDLAWNHKMSPAETLSFQAGQVQQALDRHYNPPTGRKLSWGPLVWVYLLFLAVFSGLIYRRHKSLHRGLPGYARKEWRAGAMFVLPWIVGFIVLSGGPMLFSAVMSFTRYDVLSAPTWVGTSNYTDLTGEGKDPLFYKSLGNTLFMGIGLPIGMAVGLALAMLLNAKVRGMSFYRTLYFLPAIMPMVAASILWIWVFNAQNGMMNWMLRLCGIEAVIDWLNINFDIGLKTPIAWLTSEKTAKPALIIMMLWGAGASMIIWLAGLKEIPTHLYEAAELDGAGPIRRFFLVTLPLLTPYILFNLVMGLIQTFQIFTQAYIMTPNGSPSHSTYFYVYKLFDECFSYFRLGYGAAMAWILFVIVILITLFNMVASKKWVHYAGE
ncbi:MAG: ABC transporter permease subunit [bacterium]|nr:ABC transporter permease subunit [bacterium]